MSRRRVLLRRSLRALAVAAMLAAAFYASGLVWFAEEIPHSFEDDGQRTDAVVVLTGGPLRLKEGLALIAEGRAQKLFVSGVHRGVDVAELLRVAGQPPAGVACCVVLGYSADNTFGNALETREWMVREGFTSLRIVTASYHMPRSLLEFRHALPEAHIVPHPVFPDNFKRDDWWQWRGTLLLIVSEYHKFLAAWARTLVQGTAGMSLQRP